MVETDNTHQQRPPREDPETVAKHAIRVLETRLYEDFGLKLRLGAELEYAVYPLHPDAVGVENDFPIHLPSAKDQLQKKGFAPAIRRSADQDARFATNKPETSHYGKHLDIDLTRPRDAIADDLDIPRPWHKGTTVLTNLRDPLFPDSHYVAYNYDELADNIREVVISHEGRHDSLEPDGKRALTFARSIEALRDTMVNAGRSHRRFARDPEHNALLAESARDWGVHFRPTVQNRTSLDTRGLHINMSLVNRDNKPVLYHMGGGMAERLRATLSDGNHLLLPDDASIARESERKPEHNDNECVYERARQPYLEVRRPAANSNPYYATMLVLLGVYHHMAKLPVPDLPVITVPSHQAFAERFFRRDNMVITTLNQLEPELGTRLSAAVTHTPPGQEASARRLLSADQHAQHAR